MVQTSCHYLAAQFCSKKNGFTLLITKMLPLKKDLKLVRSLHQKKFRNETGLFIVEGLKMVQEALQSQFTMHSLYSTDDRFVAEHAQTIRISPSEMGQISALNTPSGHLIVLQKMEMAPFSTSIISNCLILDGISDPGNMGTIMRSAEWFGISHIFCSDDTVELYNPKVVQSSMGSIFRISVATGNLKEIGQHLKSLDFKILGTDMQGTSIYRFSFPPKVALLMGSESHGIRQDAEGLLDAMLTIPGQGKAESLNVAVATSVILAEMSRRGSSD
jgi:RNA methyltransferase, TrmH family